MFGLGAGEILIILVFALIFIGPKKLPELAKNLGRSLREFQKAKDDFIDQVNTPDSSNSGKLTGVSDQNDSKEYAEEAKKKETSET